MFLVQREALLRAHSPQNEQPTPFTTEGTGRGKGSWAPGWLLLLGKGQHVGGDPCRPSVLQVYSIISVQLLVTVAIIAVFTFV